MPRQTPNLRSWKKQRGSESEAQGDSSGTDANGAETPPEEPGTSDSSSSESEQGAGTSDSSSSELEHGEQGEISAGEIPFKEWHRKHTMGPRGQPGEGGAPRRQRGVAR